jgi:hypothetical protein
VTTTIKSQWTARDGLTCDVIECEGEAVALLSMVAPTRDHGEAVLLCLTHHATRTKVEDDDLVLTHLGPDRVDRS